MKYSSTFGFQDMQAIFTQCEIRFFKTTFQSFGSFIVETCCLETRQTGSAFLSVVGGEDARKVACTPVVKTKMSAASVKGQIPYLTSAPVPPILAIRAAEGNPGIFSNAEAEMTDMERESQQSQPRQYRQSFYPPSSTASIPTRL